MNFLGYSHWFMSIRIYQIKDNYISVYQARYATIYTIKKSVQVNTGVLFCTGGVKHPHRISWKILFLVRTFSSYPWLVWRTRSSIMHEKFTNYQSHKNAFSKCHARPHCDNPTRKSGISLLRDPILRPSPISNQDIIPNEKQEGSSHPSIQQQSADRKTPPQ